MKAARALGGPAVGHSDRTGRRADWLRIAFALSAVAYGTNVSTPLLVRYRRHLHLTPVQVTSVFAVYAVGILLALLLGGPLADRLGRRRVSLPCVGGATVASALFVPAAHLVAALYLARFIQGMFSGAVFGVASAWLREVTPHLPGPVTAARAAVAMSVGFGAGPLVSGTLGQYGPVPDVLPYLVHIFVSLIALRLLWPVPETLGEPARGPLLRLSLPAGWARSFWLLLVPTALPVFVFPSVAATVLPLTLRPGTPAVLISGLVGGITLSAAAVGAPAARRLGAAAAPVGLLIGSAGMTLAAAFAGRSSWPGLLPASVLLGVGSGLALTAGLTLAERLCLPHERAAVYAAFYGVVYLGFAAPVVVTAIAGTAVRGPLFALAGFVACLGGWLAVHTARLAGNDRPGGAVMVDTPPQ